MAPRVRFAPSPTGFLHIGGVRTALFNWLFARHEGGEFLLRIENTDHSREVEEAVDQIRRSLAWLGLDWDGEVAFQLDRLERHQELARTLVESGHAYEDEGAIRFRMPDEGTTGWDDVVRGRIEFPNEKLEDLVLLRSDGRPTYNFASPADDLDDGITHVVRGEDHVSNTPKQIRILEALGATPPVYAHLPNVLGEDGRKLSKRHGAVSAEEFRADGYLPEALVNYLALLGWSLDEKTTVIPPAELVRTFSLDRVGASAATFDYAKLEWLNGVYLRSLGPDEYAERLVAYLRETGFDGRRGDDSRRRAPRAGEDLEARRVPRLRRLPVRAPSAGRRGARRRRADPRRGAKRPRRSRAVHARGGRGGASIRRRAPGAEAASGLCADPARGDGLEDLARPLRVDRAPRAGGDARATRAQRRVSAGLSPPPRLAR